MLGAMAAALGGAGSGGGIPIAGRAPSGGISPAMLRALMGG